jgi:hypothetical protein
MERILGYWSCWVLFYIPRSVESFVMVCVTRSCSLIVEESLLIDKDHIYINPQCALRRQRLDCQSWTRYNYTQKVVFLLAVSLAYFK